MHKIKDTPVREKGPIHKTFEFKTLKGLLFCGYCGYSMVPTRANKHGREYYYYTSLKAVKKSYRFCEVKSIPALVLENYVFDKMKILITDPLLVHATAVAVQKSEPEITEYKIIKAMTCNDFHASISAEAKQNMFNLLISKVTVWPNKIKIALKPTANDIVKKSLIENKIWI